MVEVTSKYLGNLEVELTHQPSASVIKTTAPKDNHGTGETFSPTDLLAGALGACMLTIMGITARKEQIELTGATVHMEKHMTKSGFRRIERLVATVSLPNIPQELRPKLEERARRCPVKESLNQDILFDVKFIYA